MNCLFCHLPLISTIDIWKICKNHSQIIFYKYNGAGKLIQYEFNLNSLKDFPIFVYFNADLKNNKFGIIDECGTMHYSFGSDLTVCPENIDNYLERFRKLIAFK